MNARIERDAAAETYEDVRGLIHKTVYDFLHTKGGDFDEVISFAHLAFMGAFHSYDGEKASLGTWVGVKVSRGLQEMYRNAAIHHSRECNRGMEYDHTVDPAPSPREFNYLDFLDGLTEDARFVAELALDPPRSLLHFAAQLGEVNARTLRKGLRSLLRTRGWSVQRIRHSFREVREALSYA